VPDYLVLDKRTAVEAPAGKIEVVEFFWYNCPHCNAFEPTLEAWIKRVPKDVHVRRVPVGFRDDFVPQQRLYYTLEAMDLVDKLHGKVFAAIHAEKQQLSRARPSPTGSPSRASTGQVHGAVQLLLGGHQGQQGHAAAECLPGRGGAGPGCGRTLLHRRHAGRNMPRALQIVDFLVAEVRALGADRCRAAGRLVARHGGCLPVGCPGATGATMNRQGFPARFVPL
jgi:thiol:disulfide interchange protein DsbA